MNRGRDALQPTHEYPEHPQDSTLMGRWLARALIWRDVQLDRSSRVPGLFDALTLLLVTAVYFYIARFTRARAGGVGFFTYIVPGLALFRFQTGLGRTMSRMAQEQATGTLELLLATAARPSAVIGACSLFELAKSAMTAVAVLVIGYLVFGAELTLGPAAWPGLILGLAGATAFFLGLTMATGAVLIAFKLGGALVAVVSAAIPILAGLYFAPSVLPPGLNQVARFFPLTRAADILRSGVIHSQLPVLKAVLMLGVTGLCIPIGAIAVDRACTYARRRGLLSQY